MPLAPKLCRNDKVSMVAPAWSLCLPWLTQAPQDRVHHRLERLGLVVEFGRHVRESDGFQSATVIARQEAAIIRPMLVEERDQRLALLWGEILQRIAAVLADKDAVQDSGSDANTADSSDR